MPLYSHVSLDILLSSQHINDPKPTPKEKCTHASNTAILQYVIASLCSKDALTHLHSERPKEAWWFWKYFTYEGIFMKIFEGEMFIRSQTIALLQIVCELMLYFQVIFESTRVADDTFKRNSEH